MVRAGSDSKNTVLTAEPTLCPDLREWSFLSSRVELKGPSLPSGAFQISRSSSALSPPSIVCCRTQFTWVLPNLFGTLKEMKSISCAGVPLKVRSSASLLSALKYQFSRFCPSELWRNLTATRVSLNSLYGGMENPHFLANSIPLERSSSNCATSSPGPMTCLSQGGRRSTSQMGPKRSGTLWLRLNLSSRALSLLVLVFGMLRSE